MTAGSLDLVDCARLAADSAVVQRVYALKDLRRLRDLLADPTGTLRASFVFAKLPSGRAGAEVSIEAQPQLLCQRCLQGFGWKVAARSGIEFADAEGSAAADSPREVFVTQNGQVSLRDLAEEEMLLAVPLAPACSTPRTCGRAPGLVGDDTPEVSGETRPFSALQELLRKT